jgi:phenylacetate-CoA ligase
LKDVKGIIRFQAIQNELGALLVNVVIDTRNFTPNMEKKFIANWRDRIGTKMELNINHVDDIPVEASGKYRMVKNNIKHLL